MAIKSLQQLIVELRGCGERWECGDSYYKLEIALINNKWIVGYKRYPGNWCNPNLYCWNQNISVAVQRFITKFRKIKPDGRKTKSKSLCVESNQQNHGGNKD